MFGYIRILKPELKMIEYEQYEGIYCGLCRQLDKRYGKLATFTLSYDFTFLALLRMAMDDECPHFKKARCTINPLKKCTFCGESEHLAATADAAAVMVYHKIKDNIADESFFASIPARLTYPFAARARKKAIKLRPGLDEMVKTSMQQQAEIEKQQSASIDEVAHPFANLLAKIAEETAKNQDQKRILNRFGYCLGRWIYLMDAVDDMQEDLEKDRYNPYLLSMKQKQPDVFEKTQQEIIQAINEQKQYALFTLNACLAECISAYHLLDIHRFDSLLRNILELGLPAVQKTVTETVNPESQKGLKLQ